MINRLITMEVPKKNYNVVKPTPNGNYTISDYATAFINGMGKTQQERFKKMLANGVNCGLSVALNYGIEYEPFINEVKKQLGVI